MAWEEFPHSLGQSLLVLCRSVGREVRFDPVTDLIPIPNPVAPHAPRPATQPLHSITSSDKNEPSFTLFLVQSGGVPKAIEFFFDRPADVPPA
jgi:hypothetical protein